MKKRTSTYETALFLSSTTEQRDKARQALRAAGPRHRAEIDLGLAEAGILGGDDDVAHHRDLAAAAEGKTGDRGDHRFAALRDALPAAGDEVFGIGLYVGLLGHFLDVGAGGEGLVAAGQHNGADRRIGLEIVEG